MNYLYFLPLLSVPIILLAGILYNKFFERIYCDASYRIIICVIIYQILTLIALFVYNAHENQIYNAYLLQHPECYINECKNAHMIRTNNLIGFELIFGCLSAIVYVGWWETLRILTSNILNKTIFINSTDKKIGLIVISISAVITILFLFANQADLLVSFVFPIYRVMFIL